MGTALVVEDDPYLREMVCMIIEEAIEEPQIIECATAEAAVAVLDRKGSEIDLLITDIQLAGIMTGVELAQIAKRRFSSIHVIVTSGRVKPDVLPPDAAFLPKPWKPLELIQQLHR
jgi:CheY-like chemotaxis protein